MPRWGGTLEKQSKSITLSPTKQIKDNDALNPNGEDHINELNDKTKYNITKNPNLFTLSYIKQFSPRSREAMKREGTKARDIMHKPLEWFESRLPESTLKDIAQIRFNHHQNKKK
eukprot:802955_1